MRDVTLRELWVVEQRLRDGAWHPVPLKITQHSEDDALKLEKRLIAMERRNAGPRMSYRVVRYVPDLPPRQTPRDDEQDEQE
jgi:hypothetical protein